MRVRCEIEEGYTENDNGIEVESVTATCSECGHQTESFGTSDASIRRCLALMREECPEDANNFYEAD